MVILCWHMRVRRAPTTGDIYRGWDDALQREAKARHTQLEDRLKDFIRWVRNGMSAIPEPDYTWVDADHVAIGWNLISQRVFVYQYHFWFAQFTGEVEEIVGAPGTTMLLQIGLTEEPGHVTSIVLPERTTPIVEGAKTGWNLEPILAELRSVRNRWRPPEVQNLYDPVTGRPVEGGAWHSIFSGLPEMPGVHELVHTPPRRFIVEDPDAWQIR